MKKWMFFLVLLSQMAFAAPFVSKVIPIHYVKPDLLVKTLQPMLKKNESISRFENNLVVNVSAETLTTIRPIIHQLDKPKPVFHISIHQDSDNWLKEGYAKADVYSTSSTRAEKDNQSIQVMSGASAFVSTARNYPVLQYGGIGWFGPSVGYERMQSEKGFFIKPVLQGQKIRLSIKRTYSEQDQVNSQVNNQNAFETTTVVPLNQWVKLSETHAPDEQKSAESYSFHAGGNQGYKGSLYIKISIVRP